MSRFFCRGDRDPNDTANAAIPICVDVSLTSGGKGTSWSLEIKSCIPLLTVEYPHEVIQVSVFCLTCKAFFFGGGGNCVLNDGWFQRTQTSNIFKLRRWSCSALSSKSWAHHYIDDSQESFTVPEPNGESFVSVSCFFNLKEWTGNVNFAGQIFIGDCKQIKLSTELYERWICEETHSLASEHNHHIVFVTCLWTLVFQAWSASKIQYFSDREIHLGVATCHLVIPSRFEKEILGFQWRDQSCDFISN